MTRIQTARRSTPAWLRADAFPPAPDVAPFGLWLRNQPVGVPDFEALKAVLRGDDLVWTPDSRHCVLASEVPQLRGRAHALMRTHVYATLAITALLTLVNGSLDVTRSAQRSGAGSERLLFWLIIIAAPLASAVRGVWSLWQTGPEPSQIELATRRFERWVRLSSLNVAALLLSFVLSLLWSMQALVGVPQSVMLLGLRGDHVANGEWYRVLTAGLLHGSILHFLLNVVSLWVVWRPLERLAGPSRIVGCFALSVFGGAFASMLWQPHTWSVGSSGGIAGLIGFQLTLAWAQRAVVPPRVLRTTLFIIAINAVIGVAGHAFVDNAAHLGGLLTGAIGGQICSRGASNLPLPATPRARTIGGLSGGLLFVTALFAFAGLVLSAAR